MNMQDSKHRYSFFFLVSLVVCVAWMPLSSNLPRVPLHQLADKTLPYDENHPITKLKDLLISAQHIYGYAHSLLSTDKNLSHKKSLDITQAAHDAQHIQGIVNEDYMLDDIMLANYLAIFDIRNALCYMLAQEMTTDDFLREDFAKKSDFWLAIQDEFSDEIVNTISSYITYLRPDIFSEYRAIYTHDTTHKGIRSLQLSLDRRYAVLAFGDTAAQVWDLKTQKAIHTLRGHTAPVVSAEFSSDGSYIVTASHDGSAKVWDRATGKELYTLSDGNSMVLSAVFSPNGSYIATGSWDNMIRIWDTSRKRVVKRLSGHNGPIESLMFSADGTRLLSASDDKTIKLWQVETGQILQDFLGHNDIVMSARFSHDMSRVLSGSWDGTVRMWDVATGKETKRIKTGAGVYSARFNSDETQIVTGLVAHSPGIWDVKTARKIGELSGHTKGVRAAIFDDLSRTIITASSDNTIRIWKQAKMVHRSLEDLLAVLLGRLSFSRQSMVGLAEE